MDRQINRRIDGQMGRWIDKYMDRWVYGQMDRKFLLDSEFMALNAIRIGKYIPKLDRKWLQYRISKKQIGGQKDIQLERQ